MRHRLRPHLLLCPCPTGILQARTKDQLTFSVASDRLLAGAWRLIRRTRKDQRYDHWTVGISGGKGMRLPIIREIDVAHRIFGRYLPGLLVPHRRLLREEISAKRKICK